jgi:hypothetical protein
MSEMAEKKHVNRHRRRGSPWIPGILYLSLSSAAALLLWGEGAQYVNHLLHPEAEDMRC